MGPGHISRRSFLAAAAGAGGATVLGGRAAGRVPTSSADDRARALVAKLTLDEKIGLVHGTPSTQYIGYVPGVERLRIPALFLTDGPAGIRTPKPTDGPATAFPAPIALAAGFDLALATRVGVAFGAEAKAKQQNVVFAPIVNMARVPEGGRLFEGFGEDPVLTAEMGVAVIEGIQHKGVIATVKHWIGNDQEENRHLVSTDIDERSLRELYLPPFAAAVRRAQVGAVMAANNAVDGRYNTQSAPLLRTLLKEELGFRGFVCSDYAATHDTVLAALGGLDLDLPGAGHFGASLKAAVQNGTVSTSVLDDKVFRLLRTMIAFGVYDGSGTSTRGGPGSVNTSAHADLAQEVAERGTVLVRNEPVGGAPLLPLDPDAALTIAVVGPYAATARIGGDGSSHVVPTSSVSPVDGVTTRFAAAHVTTAVGAYATYTVVPTDVLHPPGDTSQHGVRGDYYANPDFAGSPAYTTVDATIASTWTGAGPGHGIPATNFSVRWTGTLTPTVGGHYVLSTRSDDGSVLYLDGNVVVDNSGVHESRRRSAVVDLVAGQTYDLRVDYVQRTFRTSVELDWIPPADDLIAAAADAAAAADVAVVCVSDLESEGIDRENLALPGQQDDLIAAVAARNPHTIVVSNAGGPITMPWLDDVPAVLIAWYAGQRNGAALARVLAGDVDPAGRLPVTFGHSETDYPARTPAQYPGVAVHEPHQPDITFEETYSEGRLIGYRHFDKHGIDPMFCFGHGLSYTRFGYGRFAVTHRGSGTGTTVAVTVEVQNIGPRAGEEVAQLYVTIPGSSADQPPQLLKGFRRLALAAGERRTLAFELDFDDLASWDARHHRWVLVKGGYRVRIGSSSRVIHYARTVTLA